MRRRIFVIIIGFFSLINIAAQPCMDHTDPDSLPGKYSGALKLDPELVLPALLALEYYPELQDVQIEFRRKKINTLMAARPAPGFLFTTKKRRKYIIFISTAQQNQSRKMLENMSSCAQTGLIGHEYAHILSYLEKSNLEMLAFAVSYYFRKKQIERETDRIAVERGLGSQIIDFNMHIHRSKLASRKYLRNKSRNYLSVSEIESLIPSDTY